MKFGITFVIFSILLWNFIDPNQVNQIDKDILSFERRFADAKNGSIGLGLTGIYVTQGKTKADEKMKDVQNALMSISGDVNDVLKDPSNKPQQEQSDRLNKILAGVNDIRSQINSSIEAGKKTLVHIGVSAMIETIDQLPEMKNCSRGLYAYLWNVSKIVGMQEVRRCEDLIKNGNRTLQQAVDVVGLMADDAPAKLIESVKNGTYYVTKCQRTILITLQKTDESIMKEIDFFMKEGGKSIGQMKVHGQMMMSRYFERGLRAGIRHQERLKTSFRRSKKIARVVERVSKSMISESSLEKVKAWLKKHYYRRTETVTKYMDQWSKETSDATRPILLYVIVFFFMF